MSPTTLGLSILGLTTVSTGIGITIANLSNTKIKLLDLKEKFEKLGGKIESPIWNNQDPSYKKAAKRKKDLQSKIEQLINMQNSTWTFKNPNDDWENHKKSWEIWKEMDEIFQLLEKAKKIEKT